ncbi:MAG: DNA-binding protein [Coriobacteriales bacterium]|jgi:excisionase family DNA binding protein|nr:DNA-binding protein [Coriobacteriales bacterium]
MDHEKSIPQAEYLSTADTATVLGISVRRVRALIGAGELKATRLGGNWLVDPDSVRTRLGRPKLNGRPRYGVKDSGELRDYTLMCREQPVLDFVYDAAHRRVGEIGEIHDLRYAPLGALNWRGQPHLANFREWMAARCMPKARPHLLRMLGQLGLTDPADLLFSSYGLNLSDQFWFRPVGAGLSWQELNFFDNPYTDQFGRQVAGIPPEHLHNAAAGRALPGRSPSPATGGNLSKWWQLREGRSYLYKGGDVLRREPYNEYLSTLLYERLLEPGDYVPYTIEEIDGQAFSVCPCFIDPSTELVTMADVMARFGGMAQRDLYAAYLEACQKLGVPHAERQLAKMLVCDFLTANIDRHSRNLGLIRDLDSLSFTRVAPLFDNGRGFFFQANQIESLTDRLYFYQAQPFSEYPSTQMSYVDDYSWYDPTTLDGFADVIVETLCRNPLMPEALASAMAVQWDLRVSRVNEYARERSPLTIAV